MTGNFNSIWDPNFPFYLCHSDSLFDIADSFSLNVSKPIENVLARFSDNSNNANSVLDLVFLCPSFPEFNHHIIHPSWRLFSDHTLITVDISICEEKISHMRWSLVKGSNEEKQFIKSIIQVIKNLILQSVVEWQLSTFTWQISMLLKYWKLVQLQKHY